MELRPIETPQARQELKQLLDQAFPVPAGASFFDDFPVWENRHGGDLLQIGAFDSEHLVATASLRFAFLESSQGAQKLPLPVGIIGAVATAPSHRSKGLASMIVRELLSKGDARSCPLYLLWGSEHNLYRRLGFELCGSQVRLPLSMLFTSPKDTPKIPPLHRGWKHELMPLLKNRKGGLVIDENDEAWLARHKNVQWWWTASGDKPTAYAAIGRGIDLGGMIHEWGGELKDLMVLFAHLHKENPALEILGSPLLFAEYQFPYPKDQTEYLCMARVNDPSRVLSTLAPGSTLPPSPSDQKKWGPILFGPQSLLAPLWVWGLDAA